MLEQSLIQALRNISRDAGQVIMDVYQRDDLDIQTKSDNTPVTRADFQANHVIETGLQALKVHYPVLSEESEHAPFSERQLWSRYWLVDPLDGTREFINRNGQFTVNIALMEGNHPLFGVVHAPVSGTTYWGGHSYGAWKQIQDEAPTAIRPRKYSSGQTLAVLGSRSYGTPRSEAFLEHLKSLYPSLELRKVGSALKNCLIAEGLADIYPRLGPTSEWDTAATQAVVEGAGGLFLNPDGQRFSYNQKESLLNSDFLVLGDPSINWPQFWNKTQLDKLD